MRSVINHSQLTIEFAHGNVKTPSIPSRQILAGLHQVIFSGFKCEGQNCVASLDVYTDKCFGNENFVAKGGGGEPCAVDEIDVWKVLGRVADANGSGPGFRCSECDCVRSGQAGFGAQGRARLRFEDEALDGIACAQAETFAGL